MKKSIGLDWDALREANRARLQMEEERRLAEQQRRDEELAELLGITVEELREREAPPLKLARAGIKHKKRKNPNAYARYDWNTMVRMFDAGKTVKEIAEYFKCRRSTVYNALEKKGRDTGPKRNGPARKETCKRGHDLSVHGREKKGGGRQCRECKRMRERVS